MQNMHVSVLSQSIVVVKPSNFSPVINVFLNRHFSIQLSALYFLVLHYKLGSRLV